MVKETAPLAPPPPKLLDQVRDKIKVKHYSIRTETQYVHWIKRFIFFHGAFYYWVPAYAFQCPPFLTAHATCANDVYDSHIWESHRNS